MNIAVKVYEIEDDGWKKRIKISIQAGYVLLIEQVLFSKNFF